MVIMGPATDDDNLEPESYSISIIIIVISAAAAAAVTSALHSRCPYSV